MNRMQSIRHTIKELQQDGFASIADIVQQTGITRQTLHRFLAGKNAHMATLNKLENYIYKTHKRMMQMQDIQISQHKTIVIEKLTQ